MASNEKRYVIIGASAAGMAAAEAIRKIDSRGAITVLSKEADLPYFRPMLPLLISGKKSAADMTLLGQGPYQASGIDVRLNSQVETINTIEQTISIQNGEQLSYDKLLIAAGSRPVIPTDIGDTEIDGVFALRTLADARRIAHHADRVKQVVMLGAGMMNIKAASALLELGLDITMVELEAEILPWLMESEGGALIRNAFTQAGVKIITGCTASQILSDKNGVNGVLLNNGRELPCQMFCIGIGVTPNVDFLKYSGIELERGVVVDHFASSNAPNVYAAGDVAETVDSITGKKIVTGLWTNAVEMGRCAGYNMAGRTTEYTGAFGVLNATQVADQPFVSMGIVHTSGTDYETHVFSTQNTYRKLVFSEDGERLVGAVFVGDISHAGLYRYVIREKMDVAKIKPFIIKQTLHYGHLLLP